MRRLATLLPDLLVFALFSLGNALVRALGPDRASALGGAIARKIGPLLPVHRIAVDNLRHAMPELDAAAQARILRGAWENLGRMACEYAHIDRISAYSLEAPESSRVSISPEVIAGFLELRDDGKPALIFSAHLGNWELPAAIAAGQGLDSAALYRTPNNRFIARRILKLRTGLMGQLVSAGGSAPLELSAALRRGGHVGMLIDQHFSRGIRVRFFGRQAFTNTLFARLARHYDCPVYGVRAVRTKGVHFRMELTGPIALPRDAGGQIDIAAATATITDVVAGWVTETPEQWLWMHRRWRPARGEAVIE